MRKAILSILVLFAVLALTVMPAMAAEGEENVKIIDASDESKIERVDNNEEEKTDIEFSESEGFNKLLQSRISGVNTVMKYDPLENASLISAGLAIGISIILTVIAFAANNGRISLGSILGNWKAMVSGRNMMLWVFLGFCGFLLALATMKYVSTAGIF